MATLPEVPDAVSNQTPSHDYHAEAHVLKGNLQRPIEQKIEPHLPVSLKDRRGGHLTRASEHVNIEGLVSFTKGKVRVSGSRSLKNNGWVTLSTSITEGLNVLEIITADRIVAQVSTEHPYENGHVPQVTFLGTQFTNFRVSGFPVALNINLGICGQRPADDRSYLQDPVFLNRVKEQTAKIAHAEGLPKELKDRYDERLAAINELIRNSEKDKPCADEPKVTCSLVESIGDVPVPGVQSFGNVLVVPEFGWLALGEIVVGQKNYEGSSRPSVYFELTGIHMKMGCVGDGVVTASTATANGHTRP